MVARVGEAVLDLIPARRRRRFGDAYWDYDHDVNTTWSNVPMRTRVREALLGAEYQATDPVVFAELMETAGIDAREFAFVDLGSGKGRALLLAAEYPFRRIIGVELLPELHQIAAANVKADARFELVQGDAAEFAFPPGPLFVYMFNPFPENVMRKVLRNLQCSAGERPRPVWVAIHNLLYPQALAESPSFGKVAETVAFTLLRNGL